MEVSVTDAAVTVSEAAPLWPSMDAVIDVEPALTPLTIPEVFTVAIAVLAAVHLADSDTLPVEPSLNVAVATNCCDAPVATLAVAGETASDVIVRVPAADPQPEITTAREIRQKARNALTHERFQIAMGPKLTALVFVIKKHRSGKDSSDRSCSLTVLAPSKAGGPFEREQGEIQAFCDFRLAAL
jgi:hypothetical protein